MFVSWTMHIYNFYRCHNFLLCVLMQVAINVVYLSVCIFVFFFRHHHRFDYKPMWKSCIHINIIISFQGRRKKKPQQQTEFLFDVILRLAVKFVGLSYIPLPMDDAISIPNAIIAVVMYHRHHCHYTLLHYSLQAEFMQL